MTKSEFSSEITSAFIKELNYELADSQIEQLFDYMNYLISENKKYNLTAIVDPIEIIYKHFLDSCELLKFRNLSFNSNSFIDIGCGAGFPSIPLAIIFKYSNFTLVDSVNKKINFINSLSNIICLNNVFAIHARAEDIGHDTSYKCKYDYSLSRAVSKVSVVLEYSAQFVKLGGCLFLYKLADIKDELDSSINSQSVLNIGLINNVNYTLPNSSVERTIFQFFKSDTTPSKYPRKSGIPLKNPL